MHVTTKLEHKDRIVLALTGILVGFFALLYYAQNRTPQILNYPNDRTQIVVFGDSLAAGVGSEDGEGFVDDLEFVLNREIITLGVSGNTTRDGLIRINDVLNLEPQIVLISLGGNDFIRRVPEEEVRRNFNKIISKIQNDGAMVMILGTPGYGNLYEELAADHQAAYVPNILKGLIARDKYMSDAIHPNDVGYNKIAEKILPRLQKFIQ